MNAKKTTLALAFGMMVAGGSWAATDGTIGADSEGSLEIDLQIGEGGDPGQNSILIRDLDDIDLGKFGEGNLEGGSNFCVYMTGTGTDSFDFNLTPTGLTAPADGSANGFVLVGANSDDQVGYDVYFKGSQGATAADTLLAHNDTEGVTASAGVGLNPDYTCAGENVSIFVKANFTEASEATADNYEDTLTLLVSPQ